MGNIPIAKSFKGILRVSPIIDGTYIDNFLTENYYKNYNPAFEEGKDSDIPVDKIKLNFADGSYNSTEKALDGMLNRYSSSDHFKNGKLPVTDSVGNYMNFNVGTDGTVFGSAENEKNNNDIENGSFPILESNHIVIGLEKIKLNENKKVISGGRLNIVGGTKQPALYIENDFCQSDLNVNENSFYDEVESSGATKYTTMYTPGSKEVKEYDSFVLNQEFNHKDNKGNIISKTQIRNLVDIVKNRLEKYLQNSVIEMPVGSVIWQYINLNKWYAADDDGNMVKYAGHRPKMLNDTKENASNTSYPFYSSRIQGVSKEINRLAGNRANRVVNEDGSSSIRTVREIIPLYKRDYVLCDGTAYTVPCCLYEATVNGIIETEKYASYNRFKNLFSTIGYYYTDIKKINKHYQYNKNGEVYQFKTKYTEGESETRDELLYVDSSETDKEVLFGRDYCQMLAFYYIYRKFLNGDFVIKKTIQDSAGKNIEIITFNRSLAENWLKGNSTELKKFGPNLFDKEDLFTSPTNSDKQLYYIQKIDNKEFKIELGTEVNSFNSKICLTKDLVCEVWQLPEVQFILDLFDNAIGDGNSLWKYYGEDKTSLVEYYGMNKMLEKYCVYSYQVPNFNTEVKDKYKMGCFMGSNGYYSMSSKDELTQSPSNCFFTANELPHRHSLFIGWNHYGEKNPDCKMIPPVLSSVVNQSSRCSAYGIATQDGRKPGRSCNENDNNYVMQFDTDVRLSNSWLDDLDNLPITINRNNGYCCEMMVYTTRNEPIESFIYEPDRGITSDQVDEKMLNVDKLNLSKSFNLIEGSAEYFAPESIMMLPLIKL